MFLLSSYFDFFLFSQKNKHYLIISYFNILILNLEKTIQTFFLLVYMFLFKNK